MTRQPDQVAPESRFNRLVTNRHDGLERDFGATTAGTYSLPPTPTVPFPESLNQIYRPQPCQ